MIRSRDELEAATEKRFCEEFLVPLFGAMGFQDVVYYHGGPLELGKDIVMWKADDFNSRVNYAVVAKAQKITGTSAVQSDVISQVRQAFATPFRDVTTAQEHRVDRVLVACSKQVTKEALASLGPQLENAGIHGHIDYKDSEALWRLAEQHLAPALLADSLRLAQRGLQEADPDYTAEVLLKQDGVYYTILPKHEGAGPLKVGVDPRLANSPEGERVAADLQDFLRTGRSISVNELVLPIVDPPPLLRYLTPPSSQGPYELSMLPRAPANVMIFRVRARSRSMESEIPYVHFTTIHGGLVESRTTNELQPIPIRIELQVDRESKRAGFRWTIQPRNVSLYWALLFCHFASVLTAGAEVLMDDLNGGGTMRLLSTHPGELGDIVAAVPRMLDLLTRVETIEKRTGQPIVIENLENITSEQIGEVLAAERLVRTGRFPGGGITISANWTGADVEPLEQFLASMEIGKAELKVTNPSHHLDILGTQVDFGPVEAIFERPVVHPDDLPAVRAAIAAQQLDANNPLGFRIVSAPGTRQRISFGRWPTSMAKGRKQHRGKGPEQRQRKKRGRR